MILLTIMFGLFLVGGVLVIKKFINSGPSQDTLEDKKYKVVGAVFAVILLGIWLFFGAEFFKSFDRSYELLTKYGELSGSFYSKITELVFILYENGENYGAARIILLREDYLYYIVSYLGAYLALYILWKITNPPDPLIGTNTKFRRIGVIFSIIFVIAFLILPLFSSILIFYEYLN